MPKTPSYDELEQRIKKLEQEVEREKQSEKTLLESKALYQELLAASPTVIYRCDPNGQFPTTFVSENVINHLGYKPKDFTDDPGFWADHIHPDDRSNVFANLAPLFETGHHKHEYRFLHKDGTYHWMHDELRLIRNDDGLPKDIIGNWVDITNRKIVDEKLKESEEKYRIFVASFQGIAYQAEIHNHNPYLLEGTVEQVTGYSARDFINGTVNWGNLIHPDDAPMVQGEVAKLLSEPGYMAETEYRILHKNGEERWVRDVVRVIRINGQDLIQGTAVDITERKQAEEEFSQIFSMSLDMICIADINTASFIKVNPAFTEILGFSEDELLQSPFLDFIHPEDLDSTRSMVENKLRVGKKVINFENRCRCKDGSYRWLSWVSHPIPEKGVSFAVARDVSDRKRIEASIESQNRLMSTILDNIQVGVFMVEAPTGKPLLANKHAMELLGRGIMNGADQSTLAEMYQAFKDGTDELYPQSEMPIVRGLKGENQSVDDMVIVQPDGKKIHLHVFGSPVKDRTGNIIASIASFSDITDLKAYEAQLQQAQKLEAIGTLAGGIAHDFNNILGIIVGNTEIALDDVPEWNPARLNLEEVVKASLRAKDVIRQLLSFSRKSEITKKPISIGPIIRESLKLMRSSLPTTIDIRMNISEKDLAVLADPTQLHQIIINLCTNAAHAMSENGGILEISLYDLIIDEAGAMNYADINAGPFVCLSIRDTGHGIPPEIKERIFDPYFTTKGVGKGTGMGLAVVHGIVKNHNGAVAVCSEPGHGAHFEILLPAIDKPAESQDVKFVDPPTGSGRILFIDDEQALIDIGKRMLEQLGYNVFTQTRPLEALDLFTAQPHAFDLIITDMTMPKMTGDKLTKEILKIRPNMPIILCTGFSEKINIKSANDLGIRKYIEKPLNKYDLSVAVREVLFGK